MLAESQARLFRQHQLQLTDPSYRNDSFRPGWYPDALIPVSHPVTGKPLAGARFVAMPFDLPASQTHGFWVDLYVPAGTKPGEYRGVYRVRSAEGQTVEVPVVLTVWGFELPETPTMKTEFGSPAHSLRGYYEHRAAAGKGKKLADEDAAFRQVSQLLSEHRFNATPKVNLAPQAQPDGTFRIPSDQIRTLRDFVDRYHVNAVCDAAPESGGQGPGSRKPSGWGPGWRPGTARRPNSIGPMCVLYTYLLDEPNDEQAYRYVQKWGRAIRQFKSALKVLVVEQTLTQDPKWGDLNGAIDIWCPLFCLHDEATAAQTPGLG